MADRDPDRIARAAASLWGAAAVRLATGADAVAGAAPLVVLEPGDAATAGAMLRWADADRLAVAPRGGGTKLAWGSGPARLDGVISTSRLNAPIDHRAGDLTATIPAGAALGAVNDWLGRERQWLPLDPAAADRATIGGVVATNDSGPRRQAHGTPRDLIIGVEMALADGRLAKAGGRVVKNVAGYDLARLLCGSFGSLALVTKATFKLAPLAPASRTVVATVAEPRRLGALALAIAAAPLTPSAIELATPPPRLLVRFESTEHAADEQADALSRLCRQHDAAPTTLTHDREAAAWREHEASIWSGEAIVVKIAVLPTEVADALDRVERVAGRHAVEYRAGGRAALGVLFVRLNVLTDGARTGGAEGDDAAVAILEEVRRHAETRGGSAVLVSAPPSVKARIDPWGAIGNGLPMMRAVKARFDPNGTLNPGRGPGGL